MLQANNHSPRRTTPNPNHHNHNHATDEHGQRTSSPGSLSRAGLYPVAPPAAGQGSHSRSSPSFAVPRNMDSSMNGISDLSQSQLSELMHSGRPWWAKELGMIRDSNRASHQGHHRESSLTSTIGSTGPNSPCSPNVNMPTPHIAVNDSIDDTFHDGQAGNSWNYRFAPDPAPVPQDQFLYAEPQVYGLQMNGQNGKNPYAPDTFAGSRATEPPPGMDTPYSPGMHQSIPMTSSNSAPMANFTPGFRHTPSGLQTSGESIEGSRQRDAMPDVPKLDRTMTDIYNDNLYNPNLDIISSTSPSAGPSSPSEDIFSQRLDDAGSLGDFQQRHGAAGHVPVSAPYPQGNQASHEAHLFQDAGDANSPQTISPQDSMLDFSDTDAASSNFPLFPKPEPNSFGVDAINALGQGGFPQEHYQGGSGGNNMPYMPTENSSTLFPSQDFPIFGSQHDARMSGTMHPGADTSTDWMAQGQRPTETREGGGTYSCTYHGCSHRFESPTALQKHKREGHRQANSLKTAPGAGKSSAMDTQAGPHKCQRINPGTGKICKAVFSRPYDLTRHEDTIHNARKQKVRCDLCTEEKLFSRADALTRHYRVCHPDVELPGKHKRRRPESQS